MPWFPALRQSQGNFGFGFNRLSDESVIAALARLESGYLASLGMAAVNAQDAETVEQTRRVYRLAEVPSVADYVRGLEAIRPRMHAVQLSLLTTQYWTPRREATATRLAELAGIQGGHPVVNTHYGRLGHLFCDEIGFDPDLRYDGTYRWWAVWSQGWATPDGFVWQMLPEVAQALELLGWVAPGESLLTEEESLHQQFVEGAACRVMVNTYERDRHARDECIAHFGPTCVVCGLNFGAAYGPEAEGFIHIHHLRRLSEIRSEHDVDPIRDLRPVCPNCHAVIHLGGACRDIEDVRLLLHRAAGALGSRPDP